MLDLVRPKRAKKHHLHFRRDKKEIPSRGTDLAIKSGAIERLDHAPVPRVGLTLQPKELRPFRHQDRADLNFLGHGRLLPRAHLIVTSSWLRRRCKPPVGRTHCSSMPQGSSIFFRNTVQNGSLSEPQPKGVRRCGVTI